MDNWDLKIVQIDPISISITIIVIKWLSVLQVLFIYIHSKVVTYTPCDQFLLVMVNGGGEVNLDQVTNSYKLYIPLSCLCVSITVSSKKKKKKSHK